MARDTALYWFLMAITQLFFGFYIIDPVYEVLTAVFGSSGFAALALAAYFFFSRKEETDSPSGNGYTRDERSRPHLDFKSGTLSNLKLDSRKKVSGILRSAGITVAWFVMLILIKNIFN